MLGKKLLSEGGYMLAKKVAPIAKKLVKKVEPIYLQAVDKGGNILKVGEELFYRLQRKGLIKKGIAPQIMNIENGERKVQFPAKFYNPFKKIK